ncbi:hypothetical protein NF27_JR00060 [Candidatus Jidaibacter acanthamoeba]|uniref:WGR domain-containing protein n=1 Tax=Candidatus Jidaibacter acanthamoebae TaxID=86105 RepID=A0A0C1QIP8_9RICK|nr:hypothetical protein NF27_JR00060 [Candidatus Jidaibacter acanthamoeba]
MKLELGIWKWRSDSRYYTVRLQQNLFNEWTLIKSWGGLQNNLGNLAVQTFNHIDDATKEIENIRKRRVSRHYKIV